MDVVATDFGYFDYFSGKWVSFWHHDWKCPNRKGEFGGAFSGHDIADDYTVYFVGRPLPQSDSGF
jgi:hypothetical protein